MPENSPQNPSSNTTQFPHIESEVYLDRYKLSVNDRLSYWSARAEEYLDWEVPFKQVEVIKDQQAQWFVGGELNIAYNCLDRHLDIKADDIAIVWCAEEEGIDRKISYKQLHSEVELLANGLHAKGLQQGEKVCLYATMLPEIIVSMLACARLGLIYEFIDMELDFSAIEKQVDSIQPKLIITADHGARSGEEYSFFNSVQLLCEKYECIENVIVIRSRGNEVSLTEGRDHWYHDVTRATNPQAPLASVAATNPLFMSYQHQYEGAHLGYINAGYLLYCAITYRYVFDYQDGDVFWCAANFNKVSGHALAIWGALANGSTTVIYDGDANRLPLKRFWQIVEQYQVNILYAREDGLESLVANDVQAIERESWRSLRVVGLAYSENNQAVIEACQRLSFDHCEIITTTNLHNTGQILFAHSASSDAVHGMGDPFFGIMPVIVDDNNQEIEEVETSGALKLQQSWPSQNRLYLDSDISESESEMPTLVGQWESGNDCIHTGLMVARDAANNFYLLKG